MKKALKVLSVGLWIMLVAGVAWGAGKPLTDQEKRSYAIGANVARNLKQQGLTLDPALISRGLAEQMSGQGQMTDAEIAATIQQLQSEVKERLAEEQRKAAVANKQRGTAFLVEYAKKEGVKSLPNGVLYRVLKAGNGEKPTENDSVLCHYRGTLVDGTQFDASPAHKPAGFEVAQLIRGWRAALQEMPVGSKWELVIPAAMAYGERGAPPAIGPNETLIFEVELVEIY